VSFPDRESPDLTLAAQNGRVEMRAQITVAVPAGQAWALVGEQFGQIADWASPITESVLDRPVGEGAVRTCHVRGFGPVRPGVIRERLLSYDPDTRSLSYEAQGLPRYMNRAVNRWSVRSADEGTCAISVHATVSTHPLLRPLGPALRWRLRRSSAGVLDELVHRLQTGSPHPRKIAATTDAASTLR
jgi:hypothetical protein